MASIPFYYEPDFRYTHIHPKDVSKPYCLRCQHSVDVNKAVAVRAVVANAKGINHE